MPNTSQIESAPRAARTHIAPIGSMAPSQRLTSQPAGQPPLEQWEHQLDQEWQARLKCLEQWLSKLLIKNEQLRMALALATAAGRLERDGRPEETRSWKSASHVDEP
jgi:hypothetical protein